MKYTYFVGQNKLCESATKVKFTDKFPSVREVVEEDVPKYTPKKKKETGEEPVEESKEDE